MNISFPGDVTAKLKETADLSAGADIKTQLPIEKTNTGKAPVFLTEGDRVFFADDKKNFSAGMNDALREKNLSATRNMDIVLSNTMSGEDYRKAKEDGINVRDLDEGSAETIIDHIKAALIKGGTEVFGYTDDLSTNDLISITGSVAYARALSDSFHKNDVPVNEENVKSAMEALEKALSIPELSDDTVSYMVENRLDVNVANLYKASNVSSLPEGVNKNSKVISSDGAVYTRGENEDSLKSDIERVVKDAGFEADDKNAFEQGMNLVKNGVPLTEDTLKSAVEIKSLEHPLGEETVFGAAARAIANKMEADEGPLIGNDSLKKQLKLQEIRLVMASQSTIALSKAGLTVDTAPIEQTIERLKDLLTSEGEKLFPVKKGEANAAEMSPADNMKLFYEASYKVSFLRSEAPVGVIGALKDEFKTDTLDDIFTKAVTWKIPNEQALNLYETMGTEVRRDLGDSIEKAFGNMDSLLKELKIETSDDNRRAVRILSYNRMEINSENVERVSAIDAKLRAVVGDLKPGAVLDMIREGKNPLTMTIDELSEYLSARNDDPSYADEKYSKFLFKLEQNAEISEAERESFIGIYRMFHTLERTNDAAIGTLLNTNAEMTIKNLLSATRTLKTSAKGIEFTADDYSDGIRIKNESVSISGQIEAAFTYYGAKADEAFAAIEPEKMLAMGDPEGATLPDFANAMTTLPVSEELEEAYARRERAEMHETLAKAAGEEGLEKALKELELPVSVSNLEAMAALKAMSAGKAKNIFDEAKERLDEDKEDASLFDMMDGEGFEESYVETVKNLEKEIAESAIGRDELIDLKAVSLLRKQLNITAVSAERRQLYEIPVEYEGRTVSMQVTIDRDGGKSADVTVSMLETPFGAVHAAFNVRDGNYYGSIAAEGVKSEIHEGFTAFSERFKAEVSSTGLTGKSADPVTLLYDYAAPVTLSGDENGTRAPARTLFNMAKIFATQIVNAG